MTIELVAAEYNRLKAKTSAHEDLWAGYWKLVRDMDKLIINYYNLTNNDKEVINETKILARTTIRGTAGATAFAYEIRKIPKNL